MGKGQIGELVLILIIVALVIGFIATLWYISLDTTLAPTKGITPPDENQTNPWDIGAPYTMPKVKSCVISGPLPDSGCTPGGVLQVSLTQLCAPGYTDKVRNVPDSTKNSVYDFYGISMHSPKMYVVDHLIPLELGGSNELKNLWPEAVEPPPGAKEKDQIENKLHDEVCAGRLDLATAQQIMAVNWLQGR